MLKKLLLITASFVSAFALNSVDININDKDLELGARLDVGQFDYNVEPETIFVGARFLHGDKKHSDLSDSATMHDFYEASFLMKRNISNSDLSVGLGMKVNHTEKFTTVPLGAEVTYKLPYSDTIPIYIGGNVYFAPEILSMNDAKNFLEYHAFIDAEVIKNAFVTVGYRHIDTNYTSNKGGDVSYNKSVYAGFRFEF